ncbi:MAG: hypothetical protein LBS33_07175 [Streptococcaceae bacterium]|jgi:hypothetical protein|nr:hypothetical protein [Streptococcaceae bacterium]
MGRDRIISNVGTAEQAITGVKHVSSKKSNTCQLSQSNISSMKDGAKVANQLLSDLNKLTKCVQKQADKFPQLAKAIEVRDSKVKFK